MGAYFWHRISKENPLFHKVDVIPLVVSVGHLSPEGQLHFRCTRNWLGVELKVLQGSPAEHVPN